MTKEQAVAKARKLWGGAGFAIFDCNEFCVGETDGPIRQYYGSGETWGAAFQDARINIH